MSQGSKFPIVPPLEDPKFPFRKKKNKKVGQSSSKFKIENFEIFEKTPDMKGIGYEPETETKDKSEDEVKSKVEEMEDIMRMTIEDYKKRMRDDNGPGLVPLKIPHTTTFELTIQILLMLKDIPLSGKAMKRY